LPEELNVLPKNSKGDLAFSVIVYEDTLGLISIISDTLLLSTTDKSSA
jgi:hypothetical protein